MYNQLSGDFFVALATLTAISGLIDALQYPQHPDRQMNVLHEPLYPQR